MGLIERRTIIVNNDVLRMVREFDARLDEIIPDLVGLYTAGFGIAENITEKEPGEYVTRFDRDIEQDFRRWVHTEYPNHYVYGEEFGGESAVIPEWLWGIDPIDGTINYFNGNPASSIVISLRYKGEPVLARCMLPKIDPSGIREYSAYSGGQFKVNSKIVVPRSSVLLQDALVVTSQLDTAERMERYIGELRHKVRTISVPGSSVFESCLVASGEADVSILYDIGPHEWPAAYLFAKESGCSIGVLDSPETSFDLSGYGNRSIIIAANKQLLYQVANLVHRA